MREVRARQRRRRQVKQNLFRVEREGNAAVLRKILSGMPGVYHVTSSVGWNSFATVGMTDGWEATSATIHPGDNEPRCEADMYRDLIWKVTRRLYGKCPPIKVRGVT